MEDKTRGIKHQELSFGGRTETVLNGSRYFAETKQCSICFYDGKIVTGTHKSPLKDTYLCQPHFAFLTQIIEHTSKGVRKLMIKVDEIKPKECCFLCLIERDKKKKGVLCPKHGVYACSKHMDALQIIHKTDFTQACAGMFTEVRIVSGCLVLKYHVDNEVKVNKQIMEWKDTGSTNERGIIGRICHTCKKSSKQMKKCSDCKVAYYCSEKCQKEDWKSHKTECRRLKVMFEEK